MCSRSVAPRPAPGALVPGASAPPAPTPAGRGARGWPSCPARGAGCARRPASPRSPPGRLRASRSCRPHLCPMPLASRRRAVVAYMSAVRRTCKRLSDGAELSPGPAVPLVIAPTWQGERVMDVYSSLLQQRIIFLSGMVDDAVANVVIAQLLHLEQTDPRRDVQLLINSPGGVVDAGLAIYDTMRLDPAPGGHHLRGARREHRRRAARRGDAGQAHRPPQRPGDDSPGPGGHPGHRRRHRRPGPRAAAPERPHQEPPRRGHRAAPGAHRRGRQPGLLDGRGRGPRLRPDRLHRRPSRLDSEAPASRTRDVRTERRRRPPPPPASAGRSGAAPPPSCRPGAPPRRTPRAPAPPPPSARCP